MKTGLTRVYFTTHSQGFKPNQPKPDLLAMLVGPWQRFSSAFQV